MRKNFILAGILTFFGFWGQPADAHISEIKYLRQNSPIEKTGSEPWKQYRIDYAYHISKDIDFVLKCDAENGQTWDSKVESHTNDVGICQVNRFYWSKYTDGPEYKNWKYQIRIAWELYRTGVPFWADGNKYRNTFKINLDKH